MYAMFRYATDFNQPLNNWDVASVTFMDSMFRDATDFNQPLDDWNVTRVVLMGYYNDYGNYGMFKDATNFNQPLDDWDVSSVTDMYKMFDGASNFNQCLSSWASKTPPDVYVGKMFSSSGCPNQYPDPSVGPWCRDAEQCYAPSNAPSAPLTSAPS